MEIQAKHLANKAKEALIELNKNKTIKDVVQDTVTEMVNEKRDEVIDDEKSAIVEGVVGNSNEPEESFEDKVEETQEEARR